MKWTKQHIKNAVAARARKRMTTPDFSPDVRTKLRLRRAKAKFRIQIRDLEHGDSLTLLLYKLPWPARFIGSDRKEYSAAKAGKIVSLILSKSA